MFKVAKNIDVSNENIDVKVVDAEIGKYENGKAVYHTLEELEICISGNIDNDEYCLHFIIMKPVNEYFEIEKGKKQKIDSSKIIDCYITINNVAYLDPIIELDVLRLGDKFIFYTFFRDYDDNYFGTSEFEVNLKEKIE